MSGMVGGQRGDWGRQASRGGGPGGTRPAGGGAAGADSESPSPPWSWSLDPWTGPAPALAVSSTLATRGMGPQGGL